jgi:hypothetical protein
VKKLFLAGCAALFCITILSIVAELRPDRSVYFFGKELPCETPEFPVNIVYRKRCLFMGDICDIPASPFNIVIGNRCHKPTPPDKQ